MSRMPYSASSSRPLEGELDLRTVGSALWRKKLWVILPTLLAAVASFVAVNLVTPRYKSETRVLIEGRENVFLRPEAEKMGDRERAVIDQEAVTSQVQLVLSREVARQVVKKLKLTESPEFDSVLQGFSPVRHVLILLGLARDPMRMTPEERIFEAYYERLTAYQVDKSRVIAIEFQSASPELASLAANAIADAYVSVQQMVRQEQTRAASEWLSGEIANLRPRVAEAESKVEQFRAGSNLFIGTNSNSLSNQQLSELSSQLASARSQQAEYETKSQSIRQMLKSGRPIESAEITNSELLRRLNEQLVTLRAQLAEQSSTLLDGHPRIKELRAQIGDLERQIRTEGERLVRSLENDAKIAAARVEQLSSNLDQMKRQAASSNEQDVQLRAFEREAKAQRDLLESYLAKYREATARESLATAPAEARVISRAIVSNTPFFPKKLPIVLIATLGTLLVMTGLITSAELLGGLSYAAPSQVDGRSHPIDLPRLQHIVSAAAPLVPEAPVPASRLPDVETAPPHSVQGVAHLMHESAEPGARFLVLAAASDVPLASWAVALGRQCAERGRAILVNLEFKAARDGDPTIGLANLVRGAAS
ncbi:MAG: tyrosine-protein kinase Etk/Wzc, partial [Variibacter sp.]|nr:tyrosine-protein kinase Etk/Wzc [Variibacter sp.]